MKAAAADVQLPNVARAADCLAGARCVLLELKAARAHM